MSVVKGVVFRDPLFGYIEIDKIIVEKIVDTALVQRTKGIGQTNLRPVFSSATHDRFTHSLGVYMLASQIYDKLSQDIFNECIYLTKDERNPECPLDKEQLNDIESHLKYWKVLISIASLIHDIGHPVRSHGFEFLYDCPYLDFDKETTVNFSDPAIDMKTEALRIKEIHNKQLIVDNTGKPLTGNLSETVITLLKKINPTWDKKEIPGSAHERMSVYYLLTDDEINKNLKELLICKRNDYNLLSDGKKTLDELANEDIFFIASMIIGMNYSAEERHTFQYDNFINSIKNCIVHILNGHIDADNLDYLLRNTYAAGYNTSDIDHFRMSRSFTVYFKDQILRPAFHKSALSVLENVIQARNFEPKWLYSHHKIVYEDLLVKQIFKHIVRRTAELNVLPFLFEELISYANDSLIMPGNEASQTLDGVFLLSEHKINFNTKHGINNKMENLIYPFYTYILAPVKPHYFAGLTMFQCNDADLDSLIRSTEANLKNKSFEDYETSIRNNIKDFLIKRDVFKSQNACEKMRILIAEEILLKYFEVWELSVGTDYLKCQKELEEILLKWIDDGTKSSFSALRGEVLEKATRLGSDDCIDDKKREELQLFLSKIENLYDKDTMPTAESLFDIFLNEYHSSFYKKEYESFLDCLYQYNHRKYYRSLWKSKIEYDLFLKDCANELHFSKGIVHDYLIDFISKGMVDKGFSIYEGLPAFLTPKSYREQLYYLPQPTTKLYLPPPPLHTRPDSPRDPASLLEELRNEWVKKIFGKNKSFDFSDFNAVVKIHHLKVKDFSHLKVKFSQNRVENLCDILDVPSPKFTVSEVPYIYYSRAAVMENSEDDGTTSEPKSFAQREKELFAEFQALFVEYCQARRRITVGTYRKADNNGYIFHDAVHGDIYMPDRFFAVINTPEFQRMRRIKQLATADRSFPNATHSRFAHSIGTYRVMQVMLTHFEKQLSLNPHVVELPLDYEKDAVLLAALLHDIGHGPYSHAFEEALGKSTVEHEVWTCKIIRDHSTTLHKVIQEHFDKKTCELLDQMLDKERTSEPYDPPLSMIYKSLISSQLDADRLDYLLRDNLNCKQAYGHIDLSQIVNSMRLLPIYEDQAEPVFTYRVVCDEAGLQAIDQLVYARYQMYKNVYNDPYKIHHEKLLARILKDAISIRKYLNSNKALDDIFTLMTGGKLAVADYLSLDDEVINNMLNGWCGDSILKPGDHSKEVIAIAERLTFLCEEFLGKRNSFELMSVSSHDKIYDVLEKYIGKIIHKFDCEISEESKRSIAASAAMHIKKECYGYQFNPQDPLNSDHIIIYNQQTGTIKNYGSISDLVVHANAHTALKYGASNERILETDIRYLFFSKDLLRKEIFNVSKLDSEKKNMAMLDKDITDLFAAFQPRRQIEIEKKYLCENEEIFNKVDKYLRKEYESPSISSTVQTDTYYDLKTASGKWLLYDLGFTLRVREKEGTDKKIITVKMPTDSVNLKSRSQLARHEYEFVVESYDVKSLKEFLLDSLTMRGSDDGNLTNNISGGVMEELVSLTTERTSIPVYDDVKNDRDVLAEISLDIITYENVTHEKYYQVEIELKAQPKYWRKLEDLVINPLEGAIEGLSKSVTTTTKLAKGFELVSKKIN